MQPIFIVGHSKPPKGLSTTDVYSTMSLALCVERRHGVILDADCSLVTETGRKFVRQLLVGESLVDCAEEVIRLVGERYHGGAAAALQAAWKDAVHQFAQINARAGGTGPSRPHRPSGQADEA